MKPMDGRTRRGLARRYAYADAARAVRLADLSVCPAVNSSRLLEVQFREREKLLAWLDARAQGKLKPPPGGIK